MKCLATMLVAGSCFLGAFSYAEDVPAAGEKTIALVAVGDIDADTMSAVRQFAEENVFFQVRLLPALTPTGGSLDQEGVAAAQAMNANDAFVVALVMPKDEIKAHGVYLPEARVAVVNAAVMKPEDGNMELYRRRLQRQAVRSIGMLIGLEPCPNPQCCMSSYQNVDEMDRIGMNFCPPCWDREEKIGKAKGFKAIVLGGVE
ncbi:MAG TPA: hypothetical protein DCZ95_07805 [Verrucomicrobia bacterium]|nr:MAG: hypothetical protein A2X46_01010 [Lentisphaerae bacterium GWF2_57_35]HBA83980.1 hypothetical protein [Verrucomicrobiota bacterium]